MNIQKITTLVSVGLGVIGLIFLSLIIGKGDDAIEMSAMQGDYGTVSYIIYLAQFILLITVLITLFFSLKNLASDKGNLKKSLMFIAAFAVVILVAFLFFIWRGDSYAGWQNIICWWSSNGRDWNKNFLFFNYNCSWGNGISFC